MDAAQARLARYVIWSVAAAAAVVSAVAFARYPGSGTVFLAFNLCFFACVALLLPRPRLYVYTFLSLLLALGLWAKTLLHTIWAVPFLEPVGEFGNTPEEWDRALLAMSAAALGLVAARAAHLWWARRWRRDAGFAGLPAPAWFVRHRRALWIFTLLSLVAVNAANLHFAFFQIGVYPKLLLPLRLHILLAWLVNIGFALWLSAMIWWEYVSAPGTFARFLATPVLEAFLSAASSFSRIAFVVHVAPYLLALWERRSDIRPALPARPAAMLAGVLALGAIGAVVAVFALRAHYYPHVDRDTGIAVRPELGKQIAHELPQLLARRWVGLEGVLAVGSVPGRGMPLLVDAVTDSPKRAGDSVFQRDSKLQPYRVDRSRFAFLTNAGPTAILLYSGSHAVVMLGMALIALLAFVTEEAARRWTANPFFAAVGGAALANVVSQTTYCYLTAIFLAQLWVAIALVALLQGSGTFGRRTC